MASMLQSEYLSVLEVKTRDDLLKELVRFTHQLEFQTVSATAVIDHCCGEPEFIAVDNTPAGYLDTFLDPHHAKHDPVSQHCKNSSVPIVWDQSTYLQAGKAELWEHQARFGYQYGISLALHIPRGKHLLVGIDRDKPLPKDAAEVSRMVSSLLMFTVYAQDAAMRVLVPQSAKEPPPVLTPRELDTLRWTMEGKTAWEIGRVRGIAENTVIRHAHSASRKLGCSGKHHAVVKALRLGLIE